jgi:methylmalonyl-CoA/ethylmalonyl-CoA epimerase
MTDTAMRKPAADMRQHKIVQVGIVVADAAKTAKNYSRLFGVEPWMFLDVTATDVILHGQRLADNEGCIRIAMANIGDLQIELLQPLWGPSTHMEFLRQRGEGIHHVSFGTVENHDEALSALQEQGLGIEMQGVLGGAIVFSYMDTCRELGTIFEFVKMPEPGVQPALAPWGLTAPAVSAVADMTGKSIAQLGFVVHDAEGTARRYEELLGIGPWMIWTPGARSEAPPSVPADPGWILHGVPMIQVDMRVKLAFCDWEGLQFELIEPLAGPGTHWEFLKSQGVGIHHLSFGSLEDHDTLLAAFSAGGIEIEMAGLLGRGAKFTYLDTGRQLGTIYEIVYMPPGWQPM